MDAPNTTFPYLSRVPGRNVYEKLHKTFGAAKNGINGTGGRGQIFHWVDGGWELLYDETGRPYSWQIEPLAKKKAQQEQEIARQRERYLKGIELAAEQIMDQEHPSTESRKSFMEGYTTALMKIWDNQPAYIRKDYASYRGK